MMQDSKKGGGFMERNSLMLFFISFYYD